MNCTGRIVQFINSDLGLVSRLRSLAAIPQLAWTSRYSLVAVSQQLRFFCAARAHRYCGV